MAFDYIHGIDTGSSFLENAVTTDYLSDINEETVQESMYDVDLGMFNHLLEAENNWNAINEAISLEEFRGFRATGDPYFVLEEGKLKGMFDKVISWFKSIWSKVLSAFKKFTDYIMSKVRMDREFVRRFKGVNLVVPNNFKVKGYKYNVDMNHGAIAANLRSYGNGLLKMNLDQIMSGNSTEIAKKEIEDLKSDMSKVVETMHGIICDDKAAPISNKEFGSKLKARFRSASTPHDVHITQGDVKTLLQIVEDAKMNTRQAKDALAVVKKDINSAIDEIIVQKRALDKGADNKLRSLANIYANMRIKILKEQTTALVKYNGALINALNERNRFAKSVIYAVANSTKTVSESSYGYYGDFIQGVEFE